MKTVFSYDHAGCFVGPVHLDEGDLSPLEEGVYLIPGGCTDLPPPAVGERQAAIFRNGAWAVVPDHRGRTLYTSDGQQVQITSVDQMPPEGASEAEPHERAKARVLELLKAERKPIMTVLDGLQGSAATRGLAAFIAGHLEEAQLHAGKAQQIEVLKKALKDAPTLLDFSKDTTFEEMRLTGKAWYAAQLRGAPPDIVTAFRDVA